MDYKETLKKTWHFIWHEDSFLSWFVNLVLAFLIVKFLIYPGLGLLLGTQFPIVAVVSGSMEHDVNFDQWWNTQEKFYQNIGISKEEFRRYTFKNGFNKGDLMILKSSKGLQKGNVIVFQGQPTDPIIHRIILLNRDGTYRTKGDHNSDSRQDELHISKEKVFGQAIFRIPYLGWFKIGFVELLNYFGIHSF